MVCDECVAPVQTASAATSTASPGVANAGGDAYRTKSPDAVAVSVPGKATNATTAIAASCCGELLRRALSRVAGGWWLGHSALPRLEPVVEVVTPPVDPSDDGPETALVCLMARVRPYPGFIPAVVVSIRSVRHG